MIRPSQWTIAAVLAADLAKEIVACEDEDQRPGGAGQQAHFEWRDQILRAIGRHLEG